MSGASRRRRPAVLLALVTAGALGCGPRLPDLGAVPAFTLTERDGRPVRADDLSGHVWIADFVFTRCRDVCPALTAGMAGLQRRVPVGDDPVRLVSISVDPEHDTPDVLRPYAEHAGAGPSWIFLTGSRDAIATLLAEGFHLAFATDGPPEAPITHSDRFVLVDRTRRIRGYYHGRDPDDVERLVRDAGALHAGRAR